MLQIPRDSVFPQLAALARIPPGKVPPADLCNLARALWYGADVSVSGINQSINQVLGDLQCQRQALYLLDVLSRFSCMGEERAATLRGIVASGASLKPRCPCANAARRVARYELDPKAHAWGLEEDICRQMQYVLPFQTRHYAASQRMTQGSIAPRCLV